MISTLKGWQKTVAPHQGAVKCSLPSDGLRYASATLVLHDNAVKLYKLNAK
jgi:hypothetical protein